MYTCAYVPNGHLLRLTPLTFIASELIKESMTPKSLTILVSLSALPRVTADLGGKKYIFLITIFPSLSGARMPGVPDSSF